MKNDKALLIPYSLDDRLIYALIAKEMVERDNAFAVERKEKW